MTAIRPARADEAPELSALVMRSKSYWGYDAAFMERARSELTVTPDKVVRTWVADVGGAPAGIVTLGERGARVEIDLLFVEPEMIGSGVGRALWDHAVTVARDEGAGKVFVQSDPNAEAFYLRMGARKVGASPSPSTGRMLTVLEMPIAAQR